MNNDIPQYIEGVNPGFQEINPLTVDAPDSPEQAEQRKILTAAIKHEYWRLTLDNYTQEYLEHQNGVSPIQTAPLFQLKLYSDYLKMLVKR